MSETDPEIAALATLIKILEPLTHDQRTRVLEFVFHKLNIRMPGSVSLSDQTNRSSELAAVLGTELARTTGPSTTIQTARDISSLKEAKRPRTANEMAALVAFYLEHVATGDERRDFITANDVQPYFNQAGFPLPTGPARVTLVNAKNAGYLNARDRGQYRLNPVGYNLIAYKLPADAGTGMKVSDKSQKKVPAKRSRRKKGRD